VTKAIGPSPKGYLSVMPKKPNYNFAKQQKELARERKRNAKEQAKRERKEAERETREPTASEPSSQPNG
jgi:hypothetical protein